MTTRVQEARALQRILPQSSSSQLVTKYKAQIAQLHKSFPEWPAEEVATRLEEADGDVQTVYEKKAANEYEFKESGKVSAPSLPSFPLCYPAMC